MDCNDDLISEASGESMKFNALNEVLAAIEAQTSSLEREEMKDKRPSLSRQKSFGKKMPCVEVC
jgi:hypothetical protein